VVGEGYKGEGQGGGRGSGRGAPSRAPYAHATTTEAGGVAKSPPPVSGRRGSGALCTAFGPVWFFARDCTAVYSYGYADCRRRPIPAAVGLYRAGAGLYRAGAGLGGQEAGWVRTTDWSYGAEAKPLAP
jgi:hypothetical protein